jgi:hypothetical protein
VVDADVLSPPPHELNLVGDLGIDSFGEQRPVPHLRKGGALLAGRGGDLVAGFTRIFIVESFHRSGRGPADRHRDDRLHRAPDGLDLARQKVLADGVLGELITAQRTTFGLNPGSKGIGKSAVPKGNLTPTLASAGIDKKLSARSQKLAAVPAAKFEGMLGEWRRRHARSGWEKTRADKAHARLPRHRQEPCRRAA